MSGLSLARFRCCTKCGCTKPATLQFFHRKRKGLLDLRSVCKVCRAQDNASNRESIAAYNKAYGKANRERYNRNWQRWCERHLELHREQSREYQRENKAARYAYQKEWRKLNPEKVRALRARRDAVKRGQGQALDADEILQMYEDQGGLCAYCESPLFGTYHVDHMTPVSRGGRDSWENLAITCPTCNMRKFTKTVEEFMA